MPRGVYPRKNSPWTDEVLAFIKQHASDDTTIDSVRRAVNERFGLSLEYQQVKGIFFRFHLPYKRNVRHNIIMTDEQAEYMLTILKGRHSADIARMMNAKFGLNLAPSQIRCWKKNHKTPSGYDSKYRAGARAWNRGMKFPGSGNAGSFEKGNFAFNRVPIGTIRKHGDYWMIKVRDGKLNDNWQFLHHHIWEKEHGPVPEGYRLMFRDMNPDNVTLDNIVMVSIKDAGVAAMKYGLTNDPEINDAIFNVTKLRRITKEKADNGEN